MESSKEKDNSGDFLDWVGPDISAAIFCRVDHPANLLRDFCKKLCQRLCPEAATFAATVEVSRSAPLPPHTHLPSPESSTDAEAKAAQAEFKIYSYLWRALLNLPTPPSLASSS